MARLVAKSRPSPPVPGKLDRGIAKAVRPPIRPSFTTNAMPTPVSQIESMQRALAELRTECAALRAALRERVIFRAGFIGGSFNGEALGCRLCNVGYWRRDEREKHSPGCLAAQEKQGCMYAVYAASKAG